MSRVDTFIKSVEEFDSKVNSEEVSSIIFSLLYKLGDNDALLSLGKSISISERIQVLKNRIENLIDETNIKESFLVNALILDVENELEHLIREHGQFILRNMSMEDDARKEFGDVPDFLIKGTERVKDFAYRYKHETALEQWKIIVLNNFSYSNRQEWEYEEFKKTQK